MINQTSSSTSTAADVDTAAAAQVSSTGRSLNCIFETLDTLRQKKRRRIDVSTRSSAAAAQSSNGSPLEGNVVEKERTAAQDISKKGDQEEVNTVAQDQTMMMKDMIPILFKQKHRPTTTTTMTEEQVEVIIHQETNDSEASNEGKKEATGDRSYLARLEKLKKENQDIIDRKQKVIRRYANLVYSYEYGLNSVRKLNDLRFAPDNVLKGDDYVPRDQEY